MNIQGSFLVCQEKPSRWFFNLRHTSLALDYTMQFTCLIQLTMAWTILNLKFSALTCLVQNTFEDLEDSGCIKMNEDNVEPTMLGSIASQYYLSYMTVSMFGSNIGSDTSLEVVLHILSAASEYNAVPVRHNEENYNEALSDRVRYKADKDCLDDPHVKANLLFQLELPISDYVTGLKSVLDQSIRIIQAMIDICANSGWISSSITCMHLLQMVMQ